MTLEIVYLNPLECPLTDIPAIKRIDKRTKLYKRIKKHMKILISENQKYKEANNETANHK